jgi:hypothetical protein
MHAVLRNSMELLKPTLGLHTTANAFMHHLHAHERVQLYCRRVTYVHVLSPLTVRRQAVCELVNQSIGIVNGF